MFIIKCMKKETHRELKNSYESILKLLKDPNLSKEEREKLEILRSKIAGTLLSSWLPFGFLRKALMFVVAVVVIFFFVNQNYTSAIIGAFILFIFSPRIVGEVAHFIGFLFRK